MLSTRLVSLLVYVPSQGVKRLKHEAGISVLSSSEFWKVLFTFMWPCIVTNFFIMKPTRCTKFLNLLRHETLHVSDSSSAHHQEFIHCTLGTGMFEDSFRAGPGWNSVPSSTCSKAVFKPVWHIPVPSVQWVNFWWWQRNCPKHVEFHAGVNLGNWYIWLVLS